MARGRDGVVVERQAHEDQATLRRHDHGSSAARAPGVVGRRRAEVRPVAWLRGAGATPAFGGGGTRRSRARGFGGRLARRDDVVVRLSSFHFDRQNEAPGPRSGCSSCPRLAHRTMRLIRITIPTQEEKHPVNANKIFARPSGSRAGAARVLPWAAHVDRKGACGTAQGPTKHPSVVLGGPGGLRARAAPAWTSLNSSFMAHAAE